MARTKVRYSFLAFFTMLAAAAISIMWLTYEPYNESREIGDLADFPGGGVFMSPPAEVVFEDSLGLWVEGGVPEEIHKASDPAIFAAAATGGSIGGNSGKSEGVSVTLSTISGSLIGVYVDEIKNNGETTGVKRIYVARMAQPGHLVTYEEEYLPPGSFWTVESFSRNEVVFKYDNKDMLQFLSLLTVVGWLFVSCIALLANREKRKRILSNV